MQEAIQRALEENPELAAQLDANYLNKVSLLPGLAKLAAAPSCCSIQAAVRLADSAALRQQ
jgi:hypothetical protein